MLDKMPAINIPDDVQEKFRNLKTDEELFSAIVNTPFLELKVQTAFLFLGIVVFLQVNKEQGTIDRIALSNTELAKNTTEVSYVPFEDIKIPVDDPENILSRAIQTGEPKGTTDWYYLFTPAMPAEQARINQASGGIAYSEAHPLKSRDGGAIIFSYFQYLSEIGEQQREFMKLYTALVDENLAR